MESSQHMPLAITIHECCCYSPFKKAVKKLHNNQKRDLDHAVQAIIGTPSIGTMKVGADPVILTCDY